MHELTLAKHTFGPAQAAVPAPRCALPGWLAGLWHGLVRHAERPDRVVPYY